MSHAEITQKTRNSIMDKRVCVRFEFDIDAKATHEEPVFYPSVGGYSFVLEGNWI